MGLKVALFLCIFFCKYLVDVTANLGDCTPGPVTNLELERTDLDVRLSWDPPQNQSCPPDEYYVSFHYNVNETVYIVNTTAFNGTLPEYCNDYMITVIPSAQDVQGPETSVNLTVDVPIPFDYMAYVDQIDIDTSANETMTFSWDVLDEVVNCVTGYDVTITKGTIQIGPNFTTDVNATIEFDQGCDDDFFYILDVAPVVNASVIGDNYRCNCTCYYCQIGDVY